MIPISVAKDMVDYVDVTGGLVKEQQEKIASLEAECSQLKEASEQASAAPAPSQEEKEVSQNVEKQASQEAISTPPLGEDAVVSTVGNMIQAGFLKEAEREEAEKRFQEDPSELLSCLNKLAERSVSQRVPSMGHSVPEHDFTNGPAFEQKRESDEFFEKTFSALYHRVQ